eukprot:2830851-Amphidinium_carterae.1
MESKVATTTKSYATVATVAAETNATTTVATESDATDETETRKVVWERQDIDRYAEDPNMALLRVCTTVGEKPVPPNPVLENIAEIQQLLDAKNYATALKMLYKLQVRGCL